MGKKGGETEKKGDRVFIGNLRDCDRVLSAPAGSSFSFTIHVHVGRGLYLLGTSLLPIGDEQHCNVQRSAINKCRTQNGLASPVPNLFFFFFFFPQTKTGLNCQCSCGNSSSSSSPLVCLCVCFLAIPFLAGPGRSLLCVNLFSLFPTFEKFGQRRRSHEKFGMQLHTLENTLGFFSLSLFFPTSPFVVFSFSFLKFSPPQSSLHILLYGGEIVYDAL